MFILNQRAFGYFDVQKTYYFSQHKWFTTGKELVSTWTGNVITLWNRVMTVARSMVLITSLNSYCNWFTDIIKIHEMWFTTCIQDDIVFRSAKETNRWQFKSLRLTFFSKTVQWYDKINDQIKYWRGWRSFVLRRSLSTTHAIAEFCAFINF